MSDGLKLLNTILSTSATNIFTRLDSDLFIGSESPVYEFINEHRRSYRELPQLATVAEELGIRWPRATEAMNFYLDQVYERREYNLIHERWGGMRDAMRDRNMDQVRENVHAMARATRSTGRQGREVMPINQAMGLVVDRLRETRGYGGITGVPAGWASYDEATGGYQNGDLVTIVGRMGLGKTYVLLKQAWHAYLQGENVLFVTTEMGLEQIARRAVSIALGVNPTFLKRNMISSHMERRISRFYTEMMGADRFNVFSVGMKSKTNAIEALMQEYGPTATYVDGMYLLKPTDISRSANRIERITAVVDEMKGMALDSDTPIIQTSQFNRQAGKSGKEGSLETISYTDAIGTHSSVVAALKAGPTENPMESRLLEFLKGREGETGQIAINFKFAPLDMDEFTLEQAQQQGEQPPVSTDWMS